MNDNAAIGLGFLALAGALLIGGGRVMRTFSFEPVQTGSVSLPDVIDLTPGVDFAPVVRDAPVVQSEPVVELPPPLTAAERLSGMSEREVVARTAWGEARSGGVSAMASVIAVIRNRSRRRQWPNSPKAVALQKSQFSVWGFDDRNRRSSLNVTIADAHYRAALRLYDAIVVAGDLSEVPEAARDADHYHARSVTPYWSKSIAFQGRDAAHLFYKA